MKKSSESTTSSTPLPVTQGSTPKPVYGRLVSKVSYPVIVKYNNQQIVVSPMCRTGLLERSLLEIGVPGVVFVPDITANSAT